MNATGSLATVDDLRRHIAALETPGRARGAVTFGVGELDRRLADGGIATGSLHEITAAGTALTEDAAATLFTTGIAARAVPSLPILWALTRFDLYAPGLEQAGLIPDRVVFAQAREDRDVLAVMEDALRDGSFGAVVGEVCRADMTATRRLQLAAADGGRTALLMRRWRRRDANPLDAPSAAATRWRIGCASSTPLSMPGVGRAHWRVDLVRQRNGAPFTLTLEGCDAQGRLGLPAASADRAVGAGRRAHAA
ncbi:ImuA family protein [Sphingomonas immobilis]|uniref:Protein ImuA n=1 Tax=Sphingomonas immobilis TaxID=3063997 RepID=A0ABT8ZXG5_9SPHN|nr:protein ImuA [Sphingomonas sp. CA1-15]MDO7841922.1 protein ImuA [Sphingomonas sp. CA1-15]